jgi:hypothetical protein
MLALLLGPASVGCATRRVVAYEARLHPTGLAAGEGVTILLHGYQSCSESDEDGCEPQTRQRGKENRFEGCMEAAMQSVKRDLRVVPAADFRRAAFQGLEYPEEPRSPVDLLQFLRAPGVIERIEPLKVRYLVVVDAATRKFDHRRRLELAEPPMWGVGSEWQKHSQLNAAVLDLEKGHEAGTLNAGSNGRGGIVFPVLLILPMPPVGWSSPTEGRACKALGRAVAQFIAGPVEEGGE